jgi:hypothetical protein
VFPLLFLAFFLFITAIDSAHAVSSISAVNGFFTFILFSSIGGFLSVADRPAAASGSAVSGVPVLLTVSCPV